MTPITRIALIGNSLPRRCGIATFTSDLQVALAGTGGEEPAIVAMTDHGRVYDYPPEVRFQVRDDTIQDYRDAADFLNASRFDVVSLQHEFGIFGGEAGSYIMETLSRLTMPIVTTLHTILAAPDKVQLQVMERIIGVSSKVVAMAEKGRELLETVYRVPADKIDVIPHGIPDVPHVEPEQAKERMGFVDKPVILTFGLLSPNKGIEVMIDAMPAILKSCPKAVYVVLGATHPNLVRHEGESYRASLIERARALHVEDHVAFFDQFVDQPTLLEFIAMCDVYVTPYLNEAQMTSGTLAYSFGLGKAVVSTPYWHARELLADGHGILVPFGDATTIGDAIAGLLTNPARRYAMGKRAYSSSRSMTWSSTAESYRAVFEEARRDQQVKALAQRPKTDFSSIIRVLPDMQIGHFLSMCDDTGLFQHAVHSVPNRAHGYCVDDNARALLFACALNLPGEKRLDGALTGRFAAFVQHAWNAETSRFRNFLGFNRNWLDDGGSEDSHGRTLWALGECARSDASRSRRRWATALFAQALPSVERFQSPRAWAFALIGLHSYCAAVLEDANAEQMRRVLADRLMSMLSRVQTPDWVWFEDGLSYDNARLPQALIVTGMGTENGAYVEAGLRALRWLMTIQTTESGLFRPVGTAGFGDTRKLPETFDQQPLEASASISACLAAWHADGSLVWREDASRAFAWFLGSNDLATALVDHQTGSCRDGLHPDRPNENRGGESVVSYLLGLAEMRQLARLDANPSSPLSLTTPGA